MDKIVSVIIPFYNNKSWLKEALISVVNQEYSNLDVIIINDGSDENIDDLIVEFSNFHFYYIKNVGAGQARNYGIEKAIGEYVCFLDSDDFWDKNKIKDQLDYMLSENLVWCHTNYVKFWENSIKKQKKVNTKFFGKIIPKMFIYCPIATPCVMIKRIVFIENKDIRFASYKVGEDSYLWMQIAQLYDLGYLNKFLTFVRIRGTNAALSSFSQLQSKAQLYIFIKNNKKLFKSNLQYLLIVLGFLLSYKLYHFIIFFQKRNLSVKMINYLSYLFYAIPYIYLKIINKILKL